MKFRRKLIKVCFLGSRYCDENVTRGKAGNPTDLLSKIVSLLILGCIFYINSRRRFINVFKNEKIGILNHICLNGRQITVT